MKRTEIVAEIFALIKKLVPEYEGDNDASIGFAEAGVDSLTTVDLVVATESMFSIEIPDSALPKLTTVADLADYVMQHENDKSGAA
ncbi:phosphopantetheine-binding protein [Nocardia sp. NBC_01499]|uniref:acyl carrier protein n=1 Tax=Nocardia sp. NBC_01499 TaxID=2903597 RepID=UPI003869E057